nr:AAA family ATPase [Candidatus Magasanikbacteria bacterium]
MTQETALNILKAGASVFLTGEPGAGKTHTINQYVNFLRDCGIEPAITASTGIAATHIGGMTIHSWSGIGIRKTLDARELGVIAANEKLARRMRKTSTLIIDEISMLDGVFLDTLDSVLQTVKENNAPFGGIQIIFVGDFFQLPPVTKHGQSLAVFAFDSQAWNVAKLVTCYLSEQHRQSDQDFLEILAAVRAGLVTKNHENILQTRQRALAQVDQSTLTKLFPHNADVDYINDLELQKLSTAPHTFSMTHTGRAALVEQLQRGCLSPETLHLKVGAIVLFTKNNQPAHYFNGTIGTVIDFDSESKYPIVKIQNGREILAEPVEWALEDSGKVLASITQVPLRLAWAITVHKSQGMSLDAAYMDLTESFVPGQGYVALSRVRALSGLHIAGWNTMALSVHPEVLIKDRDFRSASFAAEEYCTSLS